jgi:hypothetical protein
LSQAPCRTTFPSGGGFFLSASKHRPRWSELPQVAAAISEFSSSVTPTPAGLPADRPRIGGCAVLAGDAPARSRLADISMWPAVNLDRLIRLADVMTAARAPIHAAKLELGPGGLRWLRQRLAG